MKIIEINNNSNGNTTTDIIKKLNNIRNEKNVEVCFEKGEYHFYKEGALEQFVAVTNNRSCVRKIIFPLIEFDNIIINGNGSVFVFHDITTPFYVYKSKNITIKNVIFDRAYSPVVDMIVDEKSAKGFKLKIDRDKSPYCVEDGHIIFKREWGSLSTADKKLSLHLKERHMVQYLFAGDTDDSTQNLPATFMLTDAIETSDGVYFNYRENTESKCVFEKGAEIYCLADGSMRESDVIVLSDSENIKIENITIRRGLSMGIVGQLCSDIEVSGLKTDSYYKETSTLTADCMHFVNCTGNIDIHDCNIEYISDDVINIHGVYTSLKEKSENKLVVELKHNSQRFFNPYKSGDVIDIISPDKYAIVSQFTVEKSEIVCENGSVIEICGTFINGFSDIEAGFLIENSQRMPNVTIYSNRFNHFPSMRVSGGGKIVIKDNNLSDCSVALQAVDLSEYWMESGRINNLIFTENLLKNCSIGGGSCIFVGISGVNECEAPKIHDRIEISNNTFYDINDKAITASGVRTLIVKNNIYNTEKEDILSIDGKITSKR